MGKRFVQQNGESRLAFQQRIGAIQAQERAAREALNYRSRRAREQSKALSDSRSADRVDGYDRDDLGLSPDY